jgi:O-antigen/teichoic acid export membrane protein
MPSRDLGRKSLVLLSSGWATSAVGMAISVAVARRLGPDALGSIAFSLGLAGIVMAAMLPGFGQAHLKRLAEGHDPGRCLGTMATIQVALTFIFVTVLALGSMWSERDVSSSLTAVFGFVLAAQVLSNFSDIALRVFIAREWIVMHGTIVFGGRLLRAAVTAVVLIFVPDVVWVAATFTVEAVANGIAAMTILRARGVHIRAPTRDSVRSYWQHARPLLVTTPLALFQDSIDRVVVGRWAGLTEAGYYHIARALWEILGTLVAAPTLLLFTRLSALYVERSGAGDVEARALFASALDKVLFVVTPVGFLLWAFAEPGIAILYGLEFASAATALRIFVVASLVEAVVNPYIFTLYALGAGGRLVRVNLLRTVVYLAALWVLVRPDGWGPALLGFRPGDPGAAAARLVLLAFPAWLYWRWTRELAGIGFHRTVLAYAAGFAVMAAGHATVRALLQPVLTPDVVAVTAAAASLFAYGVLLASLHPGAGGHLRHVASLLSAPRIRALLAGRREGR